jgi:hypothetical protein
LESARFTSTRSTQGARFASSAISTWSPETSATGTPSSPARMVMISDSPTASPPTRTLLKRS